MDLQLKDADFSNNSVGRIISDFIYKDFTDTPIVSLGTALSNGNKVKYKVIIDNLGSMPLGTQLKFAFGASSSASSASNIQNPWPAFTVNAALGEVYSGEFIINNISAAEPYTVFILIHDDYVESITMMWHIEYECFVEN